MFAPNNDFELVKKIKNAITTENLKQGDGIIIEQEDDNIIISSKGNFDSEEKSDGIKLVDITPDLLEYLLKNPTSYSTNPKINGNFSNVFVPNNTSKVGTAIGTNSNPLEINLDFGKEVSFNVLQLYTNYGYPKEIMIQTSIDNATFTTQAVLNNENLKTPITTTDSLNLIFNMITTRYCKLIFNNTLKNANRYDIITLRFYRNEVFNVNNYGTYNNENSVPFYFRNETYSKEEIDSMNNPLTDVPYNITNATMQSGRRYPSGSFVTDLNTNKKQLEVDIEFTDIIRFNALSFDGTGYGGLNDFDIFISTDGTDYASIEEISNANIYTKDQIQYVGLSKTIETKYLRLLLKKNVLGNRYEFKNLKFYIDKKRDLYNYINSDQIKFVTKSEINNNIEVSNNTFDVELDGKALNSVQLNESVIGTLANRIKTIEQSGTSTTLRLKKSEW